MATPCSVLLMLSHLGLLSGVGFITPFTCSYHMGSVYDPFPCSRGDLRLILRTYKIALSTSLNSTFLLVYPLLKSSLTILSLGILKEFFPHSQLLQTDIGLCHSQFYHTVGIHN